MTQLRTQIAEAGVLPECEGIFEELNSLLQEQIDAAASARDRTFSSEELERFAWRNEQIRTLLGQLEVLAA